MTCKLYTMSSGMKKTTKIKKINSENVISYFSFGDIFYKPLSTNYKRILHLLSSH